MFVCVVPEKATMLNAVPMKVKKIIAYRCYEFSYSVQITAVSLC